MDIINYCELPYRSSETIITIFFVIKVILEKLSIAFNYSSSTLSKFEVVIILLFIKELFSFIKFHLLKFSTF
jgi:hypothetical protein